MIKTTMVYEDGDGPICGLMLHGHHDDETAVAVAWSELGDWGVDGPIEHPRRCYVRKVPQGDGWFQFVYSSNPGRGASPVTVVDLALLPGMPRCGWPGCPWLSIAHGARVGRDDEVPLCREHALESLSRQLDPLLTPH